MDFTDNRVNGTQAANAWPPNMARAVGLAIYSALTGVDFDYAQALRSPLPAQPKGNLNMPARVSRHLENRA